MNYKKYSFAQILIKKFWMFIFMIFKKVDHFESPK